MINEVNFLGEFVRNYEYIPLISTDAHICFINNEEVAFDRKIDLIEKVFEQDFIIKDEDRNRMKVEYNNHLEEVEVYDIKKLKLNEIRRLRRIAPYPLLKELLSKFESIYGDYYRANNLSIFDFRIIEDYNKSIDDDDYYNRIVAASGYETILLILEAAFNSSYEDVLRDLIYYYHLTRHRAIFRAKFMNHIKSLRFCSNLVITAREEYVLSVDECTKVRDNYNLLLEKFKLNSIASLRPRHRIAVRRSNISNDDIGPTEVFGSFSGFLDILADNRSNEIRYDIFERLNAPSSVNNYIDDNLDDEEEVTTDDNDIQQTTHPQSLLSPFVIEVEDEDDPDLDFGGDMYDESDEDEDY